MAKCKICQIIDKRIIDLKNNKDGQNVGQDGALVAMILVDELRCLKTEIHRFDKYTEMSKM